jgi:hypothetical protein
VSHVRIVPATRPSGLRRKEVSRSPGGTSTRSHRVMPLKLMWMSATLVTWRQRVRSPPSAPMTKKRGVRPHTWTNGKLKIEYRCHDDAKAAASYWTEEKGQLMGYYPCILGEHWHIGRQSAKTHSRWLTFYDELGPRAVANMKWENSGDMKQRQKVLNRRMRNLHVLVAQQERAVAS